MAGLAQPPDHLAGGRSRDARRDEVPRPRAVDCHLLPGRGPQRLGKPDLKSSSASPSTRRTTPGPFRRNQAPVPVAG